MTGRGGAVDAVSAAIRHAASSVRERLQSYETRLVFGSKAFLRTGADKETEQTMLPVVLNQNRVVSLVGGRIEVSFCRHARNRATCVRRRRPEESL